jgi:hypothetical protein
MANKPFEDAPFRSVLNAPDGKMSHSWLLWIRDLYDAVTGNTNNIEANADAIEALEVAVAPPHNDLEGLQGGATNDYNHLTSEEKALISENAIGVSENTDAINNLNHDDTKNKKGDGPEYNHVNDAQLAAIGSSGGGGGVSTCTLPHSGQYVNLDADQPHYIMYFHNGSDITVNSMNAFLVDLGHGLPVSPPIPIQIGIYDTSKERLGYGATTVGTVDSEMIKVTLDNPVILGAGETYYFAILKATATTYAVRIALNDQSNAMTGISGFLGNAATTLPATETGNDTASALHPFYIGAY